MMKMSVTIGSAYLCNMVIYAIGCLKFSSLFACFIA